MALQLIYLVFSKLLSWMVLRTRSDTTKEIEILVVRHQLAVLLRRTPRLRLSWTDRAVITALSRLLPVRRRIGMVAPRERQIGRPDDFSFGSAADAKQRVVVRCHRAVPGSS